MKNNYSFSLILLLIINVLFSFAQPVPGKDENIKQLVTFSRQSQTRWGDDDFAQVWYFVVPKEMTKPVYFRIFDPDVTGNLDEIKSDEESKTKFSVYGGKNAFKGKDTESSDPESNFKSGIMLASKIFGNSPEYDSKWFNFGPFNPSEGEFVEEFGGYIFKIVAEGQDGQSGNLYNYFMSSSATENKPIEGGNVFTYEYTFRVNETVGEISHIYPFVTDDVLAVNIKVFDLDDDCYMRLVSVRKKGEKIVGSKDNEWSVSRHEIEKDERKTSLNIQVIKLREKPNNNIVISITNQYDKQIPFFTIPIGGVPKFKYKIGVKN
ncbi:MAG: hypothetical protein SFY32_14975 [Bacteroidota bacterium]|nr:hypothetical protein [Bacteroidota bacterium]